MEGGNILDPINPPQPSQPPRAPTLGEYSRPSHKGYRNGIELPKEAIVAHLRPDTIRLVQNGSAFHRHMSEDPIQHLKDFLKIVDVIDLSGATRDTTRLRLFHFSLRDQAISTWDNLITRFLAKFFPPRRTTKLRNDILMFQQCQGETLYEAWTRFKDLLHKVPYHGLDLWFQIQIFYDGVNHQTRKAIDHAANGRLSKLSVDKCCEVNENLAQYEEEEWEDPMFLEEGSLDYMNATQEQLFENVKRQVEELMRGEMPMANPFGYVNADNKYTFPEYSRQEEFEGIMLTFVNNQERQIQQLEAAWKTPKVFSWTWLISLYQ
jgi:hypothetical protein